MKTQIRNERFLTRDEIDKINAAELKQMIERGILFVKTKQTKRIDKMKKQDLPEFKKYSHLANMSISISSAARKYSIPQGTISRWVARGVIRRVGTFKNRILINEQDVAYCAEIRKRAAGKLRWLFNQDGTPYTATTMKGRHKEDR